MAQERLDDLFDIAALSKQTAEVSGMLDKIKEQIAELSKLGKSIQLSGSVSGSESSTNSASKTLNELSLNLKAYNSLVSQNEQLMAKMNAMTSDAAKENIALKKSYQDLQKEMDGTAQKKRDEEAASKRLKDAKKQETEERKRAADMRKLEIAGAKEAIAIQKEVERQRKEEEKQQAIAAKNVTSLASAYDVLNMKHKAAVKAYQDAAAAGKLSADQLVVLKDRANALGDQLVKIDSAVGNYRRNVGNYSSAWNGLGMSIQQISRELPNFAQSMQLGILAISNNLPIFADELQRARDNIKALQAEGKTAPSLFSQIAKSIFSWQTALTIGITLMVAYGKEIQDFLNGVSNAEKKQAETLKEIAKQRTEAAENAIKKAEQEQVALTILYKTATDMTQAYQLRLQAVDDLQKQYPNYFANLSKEAILAGEAASQYKELTSALLIRASIEVYEEELKILSKQSREAEKKVEMAKELLDSDKKRTKELIKQDVNFNAITKDRLDAERQIRNENIKISGIEAQRLKIINKILDAEKQIPKLLIKPTTSGSTGRAAATKKETDKVVQDTIDNYALITRTLNNFEEDEIQVRNRSLAYLRSQLAAGVISQQTYEKQKQEIIKKSEADLLKQQILFLTQTLNNMGLSQEETTKVIELWQNKRIDLYKKETDAQEAEILEQEKHRQNFDRNNKRSQDEREDRIRRQNRLARQLAQETANFIMTLLDAQAQREIETLEKEKQAITARYDLEREAIDNAFLADEEKAARKKVLDAEEAERQKALDAEIRAQKRKMAILEKAQALATIAINTAIALADAKNLGLLGALSPLIIGLGAAQAATVIATPIPEYAKGKKETDSYEGLAIGGEKGTELMVDKDGKISLLTQPTLLHTRKGDRIYSNDELRRGVANEHLSQAKEYDNAAVVAALGYGFSNLNKTIKSKKPETIILDQTRFYDLQRAARR